MPFVKGDPRINRKGRPKAFDALRALTQAIVTETAKDAQGNPITIDGHIATNVEMIMRQWMKDPKRQQPLLEIAYGKVPLPIQHSGEDGGPMKIIVEYVNDTLTNAEPAQKPDDDSA